MFLEEMATGLALSKTRFDKCEQPKVEAQQGTKERKRGGRSEWARPRGFPGIFREGRCVDVTDMRAQVVRSAKLQYRLDMFFF